MAQAPTKNAAIPARTHDGEDGLPGAEQKILCASSVSVVRNEGIYLIQWLSAIHVGFLRDGELPWRRHYRWTLADAGQLLRYRLSLTRIDHEHRCPSS